MMGRRSRIPGRWHTLDTRCLEGDLHRREERLEKCFAVTEFGNNVSGDSVDAFLIKILTHVGVFAVLVKSVDKEAFLF